MAVQQPINYFASNQPSLLESIQVGRAAQSLMSNKNAMNERADMMRRKSSYEQAIASGADANQLIREYPEFRNETISFENQKRQLRSSVLGEKAFIAQQAVRNNDPAAQQLISEVATKYANIDPDDSFTPQVAQSIFMGEGGNDALNFVAQLGGFKPQEQAVKPMTEYQKTQTELRREELEIRKLEAEQKALDRRIKRETDEVKKEGLIAQQQSKKEQSDKLKEESRQSSLNAISAAEDTIQLIGRIKNSPGFESAVGARGLSSLFGILENPLPGTDAADTAKLIETLESQNFLNAIQQMKGLGALSNAEGQKVSSAIQNLSRDQSEKQLKENLNKIVDITQRAINNANKKLGVKESKKDDANTINWSDLP